VLGKKRMSKVTRSVGHTASDVNIRSLMMMNDETEKTANADDTKDEEEERKADMSVVVNA
jgi:hypothetical protein